MIYRLQMMHSGVLLLFCLGTIASAADITLTGCHVHEGQEVCLLPGGAETTISQVVMPSPTSPTVVNAVTTDAAQTTAITDCHQHGTTQYCVKGNGDEVAVLATATGSEALPTAYTGCHAHGATEMYCLKPDGSEVEVLAASEEEGHTEDEPEHAEDAEGENCHFHAGVEHCTASGEAEGVVDPIQCERKDRNYNVKLRVGLLFVILVTSGIAVWAPIGITTILRVKANGTIFNIVKQFGTGIIIATALIHLTTHAHLMFANQCLGETKFEATTSAIIMAGAFLAFIVDLIGHRLVLWRRQVINDSQADSPNSPLPSESAVKGGPNKTELGNLASLSHHHDIYSGIGPNDALSVFLLEAGIIFHSILIGITLVVAGDSVFITLFIVIVFHQMFEGLALGARIAAIEGLKKTKYIFLPLAFTVITPLGMAIGIGLLNRFNGNDPSTIIAIGTLDALSAGILLWVGFVSMLANDWMHSELRSAGWLKSTLGLISLMAGMALMGLLGKWA